MTTPGEGIRLNEADAVEAVSPLQVGSTGEGLGRVVVTQATPRTIQVESSGAGVVEIILPIELEPRHPWEAVDDIETVGSWPVAPSEGDVLLREDEAADALTDLQSGTPTESDDGR